MKNYLFAIFTTLVLLMAVSACSSTEDSVYHCPMKCEGEKTYEKPGKCPVCNMDLKAIPKSEAKQGEDTDEHAPGDSSHNHAH